MKKKNFSLSGIMQSKITWAVVAELLILLVCFIIRPDFFSIKYQPATGMLYGSLIDILNRSAEITIISMGTPAGVGMGMTPPVFLHPGDVVRCEADGIGSLTNPVA